ncbi:MAG: hypothetical protein Q9157_006067 [Trypethelium eluteriae]
MAWEAFRLLVGPNLRAGVDPIFSDLGTGRSGLDSEQFAKRQETKKARRANDS